MNNYDEEILLSVIIPTYKRNEGLPRAIESVLRNNGIYEIIIVDDNDSDSDYRTANIDLMKKYEGNKRIHYYKHEKNMNGAAARNTGIMYAKGKYITFLDDDDEFSENRIEVISEIVSRHAYDFLFTAYEVIKGGKTIERKHFEHSNYTVNDLFLSILKAQSFYGTGSNMICKKDIIQRIGGFDTSFKRSQDFEFLVRYLKECHDYKYIDDILVVKYNDDRSNIPNTDVFLNTKKQFIQKYKGLINVLDDYEKKDILYQNFREVLYWSYAGKNHKGIKKTKIEMKKYGVFKSSDTVLIPIKIRIKKILGKL